MKIIESIKNRVGLIEGLIIFWVLMILLTFGIALSQAATLELSYQEGYHWAGMNSSDTFQGSGVDDTAFSGRCWVAEGTYWLENWGVYGFYGRDRKISEEIWGGNKYTATTYYLGAGLKYQWTLTDNLLGYVGAGITEATLKHSYSWHKERLSA